MVIGGSKSIVKELREGSVTPSNENAAARRVASPVVGGALTEEVGSGRGTGFRAFIQSGRWRRPYQLLTWTISFGAAVTILANLDEKDAAGNDHCFSWLVRFKQQQQNAFFRVDQFNPSTEGNQQESKP